MNKSDLGALAERSARELEAAIALTARDSDAWRPPVLLCSARDGVGVEAIANELDRHYAHQRERGALEARRREGDLALLTDTLLRRYGSRGLERIGGPDGVREEFLRAEAPGVFSVLDRFESEMEKTLGGTA